MSRHDTPIDVPVGTITRSSAGEPFNGNFSFRDEADCRDHVAGMLWLLGWHVRIEVPVSTGGRCDVVAENPDGRNLLAIEIKRELPTQRSARRAFEQVDGYYRHFAQERRGRGAVTALLLVVNPNYEVTRPFVPLYYDINHVGYWSFVERAVLLSVAPSLGPGPNGSNLRESLRRNRAAEAVTAKSREAVATLASELRIWHLEKLRQNYPAMAAALYAALEERAA